MAIMRNLANHEQIGGQGFHASDFNIWASIFYLDSPTDYCEYLPRNSSKTSMVPAEELVMLDPSPLPRESQANDSPGWVILISLFCFFVAGLIVRWMFETP